MNENKKGSPARRSAEIKKFDGKRSRFTNIDFRLTNPVVTGVLVGLLALLILVFGVYQFVAMNKKRSPLKTITAIEQTITRSISATGYVLREETVLRGGRYGTVVPEIPNGSKVAIGDTVANIFTSSEDADRILELRQVEKDIAYYENIESLATGSVFAGKDLYGRSISDSLYDLTNRIERNELGDLPEAFNDLSLWITRRQIAVGGTVNVSAVLDGLYSRRDALSHSKGNYSEVTAPAAGYYVNVADGNEGNAEYDSALQMTPETVDLLLDSASSATPPSNTVGKLITQFNWYYICVVNERDADMLPVGRKIRVTFDSVSDGELTMALRAKNPGEDGKVALVFSSNLMNAEIATLRIENAKIFLEEYSGYPVEPSALRTVDGEVGVYVQVGNIVRFRRVELSYTEGDTILIATKPKENVSGYIKLYDEIILEGTDLYDGKIIG